TTGCSVSGVPTSEPKPVTMLMTPFGMPASVSACTRLKVESGVSCAGLITQVLPQTTAGSSFHEEMAMGKFQGVIMPQTPIGWRTAMANLLGNSEGTVFFAFHQDFRGAKHHLGAARGRHQSPFGKRALGRIDGSVHICFIRPLE